MIRRLIVLALAIVGLAALAVPAFAATAVPGHEGRDGYVNGHYTSLYAYDKYDDYYWDLGDGRVWGTVDSVDELDAETLTTCDYVVNYRADFGDDEFMDDGWIRNNIKCSGAEKGNYNSLIVSDADPRYTGDPDRATWGTWEYVVDTWSGVGNVANPRHPDYNF